MASVAIVLKDSVEIYVNFKVRLLLHMTFNCYQYTYLFVRLCKLVGNTILYPCSVILTLLLDLEGFFIKDTPVVDGSSFLAMFSVTGVTPGNGHTTKCFLTKAGDPADITECEHVYVTKTAFR